MEPQKTKQGFAAFIPYRRAGMGFEYFMQKRDENAKLNPGLFAMFGGHMEDGEEPLETLKREIMEELEYKPERQTYFATYETVSGIVHYFIEEVAGDFVSRVCVHEGQYGKFLTVGDIVNSPDVSLLAQLVIFQLNGKLETGEIMYG